jgi:hypothetical protein
MAMSSAFLARALAAALALALVSSFPPAVRAALLILDAALPTLLAALASFAVFTAANYFCFVRCCFAFASFSLQASSFLSLLSFTFFCSASSIVCKLTKNVGLSETIALILFY